MRLPESELEAIREDNLFRELRHIDSVSGPILTIKGREIVQFASNDYLGLAASPELCTVFQEAVARYGVGSGASRLITGTHSPHTALEEELASFKRTQRALSFSSGYSTAVGTLTSLLGKNDFVILDKLCHACLIDGARLSGATMRVFPHNDLARLESHLAWAADRAKPDSRILVVTESIFSMDGDRADLPAIVALKNEFGALLLVDEAHAVGIIGPEGRGLAEQAGVAREVDLQMGTLSKAVGVSGGYLCASADWIDLLINRARSFIYSTAPPPAVAATAAESIRLIRGTHGESLRERLWENIRVLDQVLPSQKQRIAPSASPIRPYVVGDSQAALDLSRALLDSGILVPAIRFPTVPRGTARLRISLSAAHDLRHITSLGDFLMALETQKENIKETEA